MLGQSVSSDLLSSVTCLYVFVASDLKPCRSLASPCTWPSVMLEGGKVDVNSHNQRPKTKSLHLIISSKYISGKVGVRGSNTPWANGRRQCEFVKLHMFRGRNIFHMSPMCFTMYSVLGHRLPAGLIILESYVFV